MRRYACPTHWLTQLNPINQLTQIERAKVDKERQRQRQREAEALRKQEEEKRRRQHEEQRMEEEKRRREEEQRKRDEEALALETVQSKLKDVRTTCVVVVCGGAGCRCEGMECVCVEV